jgi:hypothetical protein
MQERVKRCKHCHRDIVEEEPGLWVLVSTSSSFCNEDWAEHEPEAYSGRKEGR